MKKSIITALVMVLILIAAMPLFAKATYYFPGDSVFSIRCCDRSRLGIGKRLRM